MFCFPGYFTSSSISINNLCTSDAQFMHDFKKSLKNDQDGAYRISLTSKVEVIQICAT